MQANWQELKLVLTVMRAGKATKEAKMNDRHISDDQQVFSHFATQTCNKPSP